MNVSSECKNVKMEAVHYSDIVVCLPRYKESVQFVARESHRSLAVRLFFHFIIYFMYIYFFNFHPVDNYKIIMDMSRNNWAVSCSDLDCP
jgi:hypothetical protein